MSIFAQVNVVIPVVFERVEQDVTVDVRELWQVAQVGEVEKEPGVSGPVILGDQYH
jgi:hypothetical protein